MVTRFHSASFFSTFPHSALIWPRACFNSSGFVRFAGVGHVDRRAVGGDRYRCRFINAHLRNTSGSRSNASCFPCATSLTVSLVCVVDMIVNIP